LVRKETVAGEKVTGGDSNSATSDRPGTIYWSDLHPTVSGSAMAGASRVLVEH
jgi:hypothetical protein